MSIDEKDKFIDHINHQNETVENEVKEFYSYINSFFKTLKLNFNSKKAKISFDLITKLFQDKLNIIDNLNEDLKKAIRKSDENFLERNKIDERLKCLFEDYSHLQFLYLGSKINNKKDIHLTQIDTLSILGRQEKNLNFNKSSADSKYLSMRKFDSYELNEVGNDIPLRAINSSPKVFCTSSPKSFNERFPLKNLENIDEEFDRNSIGNFDEADIEENPSKFKFEKSKIPFIR